MIIYFHKIISFIFIIILLTITSFAEETIIYRSKHPDDRYRRSFRVRACFEEENPEAIAKQFLKERLDADLKDLMISEITEIRKSNFRVTFQQTYKNLPVFRREIAVFISTSKENCVWFVNDSYVPNINISTIPTISKKEAIDIAKNDYKSSCCRTTDKKGNLKIYNINPDSLKIKTDEPELGISIFENTPRLAYEFILEVKEPIIDLKEYTIDANNGEILEKRVLIQSSE